MSALIAPLKKAQRKSEGGQLFPESVFPLRATPFPKTPQKPPTPLFFKGVSVIYLYFFVLSVRIIDRLIICLCERSEANSREGGFPQGIYFITLVVGYFACAQYDEKKSVIASRRRGNPLEKVRSIYFIALVVGYFAYTQYDVLFLYVILSMQSGQTCL